MGPDRKSLVRFRPLMSVVPRGLLRMKEEARRRFQFLSWPLTLFEASEELRSETLPVSRAVKGTRYPFLVLRYWWVINAIDEESRRLTHGPTIVDVGSDKGLLKRITPTIPNAHWIGLDRNVTNEHIAEAHYDELCTCDLETSIPLPDQAADIVVCLHILEHLRTPESTLRELVRILKPGGTLLIGTPVLPRLLAVFRQRQFDHELAVKKRQPGQHVIAFYPGLWKRLIKGLNLRVEIFTGPYLLRWTGSRLENFRLWVRFNQLIAACTPVFANELCIQLRAPRLPR